LKKFLIALFVTATMAVGISSAGIIDEPPPQPELIVNGEPVPVPGEWILQGETWIFNFRSTDPNYPLQNLLAAGNPDPILNYAVAFINPFAVTSTFTLNLLLPYIGGPYNSFTLSHSSNAADGNLNGTATVGLNVEANVANGLLDGVVVTGLETGCTITPPPNSQSCFSGADSTVAVASAAAGTFGVRLDFTLSPGDLYSATGVVELTNTAIPEPTSVILSLTGFGAFLFFARRRRSA
jgi:hypothetical protein